MGQTDGRIAVSLNATTLGRGHNKDSACHRKAQRAHNTAVRSVTK